MPKNEQLIRQLAQAWDIPTEQTNESRFSADTNTLYTGKKTPRFPSETSGTGIREKYHEIVIEQKEFEDIIKDILHFLIVKDTDIHVYDEVKIREICNFTPTGRVNVRKVTRIANATSHLGIKDGYIIIGW